MIFINLVLFLICLPPTLCAASDYKDKVRYLEPGEVLHYEAEKGAFGTLQSGLRIYCYGGVTKSVPRLFQTVLIQLDIDNDDFTQYEGYSWEDVEANYEEHNSIFSLNILSYKRTRIKLDPFNQTCIGVETIQPYSIRLNVIRIDFYKVILLGLGLSIFWFSSKLSDNPLFYYITGVLLGITASFVALVYFVSKLFPRKPLMYGVLLGGWAIALYLCQMIWENIQVILVTYQSFVFWYILLTGFISFVVCYRIGPPKNKRSKDLIKWGLQLCGMIMIFFSSQFEEASAAIVILTLTTYYFPQRFFAKIRHIYLRKFPPKPRLLTSEEYYEQGVRETSKALDDLRQYCNSPECKQWKMVTKLKDPIRFASFMEGSSHLIDEEILGYETSRVDDETSSEVSEDEDKLEEAEDQEDISEDEDDRFPKVVPSRSHSSGQKSSTPKNGTVLNRDQSYSPYSSSGRKILYRSYEREYSDEE